MQENELLNAVLDELDDLKAFNIIPLDVRPLTYITDYMIIASGTSSKHVHSIADNLIHKMKERGIRPFGVEGDRNDEWVLVDFGDIVVHIMQPKTREFYSLEKLWTNTKEKLLATA